MSYKNNSCRLSGNNAYYIILCINYYLEAIYILKIHQFSFFKQSHLARTENDRNSTQLQSTQVETKINIADQLFG